MNQKSSNAWLLYSAIMTVSIILGNWLRTSMIAASAGYISYLEETTFTLGPLRVNNGFSLGTLHIYQPFAWKIWAADTMIQSNMPDVVNSYGICTLGAVLLGAGICYMINKKKQPP